MRRNHRQQAIVPSFHLAHVQTLRKEVSCSVHWCAHRLKQRLCRSSLASNGHWGDGSSCPFGGDKEEVTQEMSGESFIRIAPLALTAARRVFDWSLISMHSSPLARFIHRWQLADRAVLDDTSHVRSILEHSFVASHRYLVVAWNCRAIDLLRVLRMGPDMGQCRHYCVAKTTHISDRVNRRSESRRLLPIVNL